MVVCVIILACVILFATTFSRVTVEYLTMSDLKEVGLMEDIINPKTGKPFIDDVTIIASIKNSKNYITTTLNSDDVIPNKKYIVDYNNSN